MGTEPLPQSLGEAACICVSNPINPLSWGACLSRRAMIRAGDNLGDRDMKRGVPTAKIRAAVKAVKESKIQAAVMAILTNKDRSKAVIMADFLKKKP